MTYSDELRHLGEQSGYDPNIEKPWDPEFTEVDPYDAEVELCLAGERKNNDAAFHLSAVSAADVLRDIESLIDDLTYYSYRHNRTISADVRPEAWGRIFPNAEALERRFREETRPER